MGSGKINILVFNCGSSSLTYKLFELDDRGDTQAILSGKATRVGVKGTEPSRIRTQQGDDITEKTIPIHDHRKAAALALRYVADHGIYVDCVGHRFVHGGSYFQQSVFVNEQTLETLKLCQPLAPIHNPTSLSVIEECRRKLGEVRQYVAFDSAYHSSIPEVAYRYALPKRITDKFGFRKYGFHGLSYSYVVKEAARFLHMPLEGLRIVACHLGTGGSSTVAIRDGRSIDTSMGYTPLSGLVMSTRCGDVDPMLAIYLSTAYGYRSEDLMDLFSKRSGLLGISGFSSDITDLLAETSGKEKEQAELALNMYVHRLRKYVGSYVLELGGIDVLLFTDDIGVRSWQVRASVCQGMEWCGLELDEQLNHQASPDAISSIESKTSKTRILSVPTNEELVICMEGVKLIGNRNDSDL
ncbi:MAG: acetate/propionate family kinase [Ignavibacteria bacterium]|nr:acetate/propionate family kinase [Ignavibacteria bacterium]